MKTTDFSVASKSQLAKLLATENLTIQHEKTHTAKFDPVNRVLYCPIWKDMTSSLYDLLLGHEVGHALYTPADGWHDAVSNKGRNFKHFLNVVEDARIEKKIKKRYPGIRRSFIEGYGNLLDRNFFGIKGKDINNSPFIDRLNLITKSSYTMDIQFNGVEQTLLEKVKNLETWSDVLAVTQEIWEYSKDEQLEMTINNIVDEGYGDDGEDGEYDEYDSLDAGSSSPGESEEESDDESDDEAKSPGSNTPEDESLNEEDEEESMVINRQKDSSLSRSDPHKAFEPKCETDIVYRKQELSLLDEKSRPFVYAELPEPILENIITPHVRVQEQLTEFYISKKGEEHRNRVLSEFKRKNERYISLLVKEFEMKKAADRFSKSKLSTTGDLDISKLYKYKVDDTIFRKTMRVPKGKSHGLILLLDKSGSMANNLKGSIEQILILSSFCRKVNIPFAVYGFGNSEDGYAYDKGRNPRHDAFFKPGANTLSMRHVMMREYLNSKMSSSEFTTACKNMLCLGAAYSATHASWAGYYPHSEELSNTPLCESIVACAKITTDFQKQNGVDIVNLVVINDGDSDYINSYDDVNGQPRHSDLNRNNFILQDRKIKFQHHVREHEDLQTAILSWFTAKTGAKIFGFFITSNGHRGIKDAIRRQCFIDGVRVQESSSDTLTQMNRISEFYEIIKKNKFVDGKKPGYKSFFLIPGGKDLVTEQETIEVDTTQKITGAKLTNAFRKFNESRQLNRVLVNQFIEGIAK